MLYLVICVVLKILVIFIDIGYLFFEIYIFVCDLMELFGLNFKKYVFVMMVVE